METSTPLKSVFGSELGGSSFNVSSTHTALDISLCLVMANASTEISTTLDATDNLIKWLNQEDTRLNDPKFLSKLGELRQEHRKTMGIIEDLHREALECRGLRVNAPLPETLEGKQKSTQPYSEVTGKNGSEKMEGSLDGSSQDNWDLDSISGSYISDSYYPCDGFGDMEKDIDLVRDILHANGENHVEFDDHMSFHSADQSIKSAEANNWIPNITIPQPFNMTVRDKVGPIKANYAQAFVQNMLRKRSEAEKEEEKRRERQFKARPVPASTHLPVYEELVQKEEGRKSFNRQYCQQLLEQKVRPFNFAPHSTKAGHHARICRSMDDLRARPNQPFQASPVPEFVRSSDKRVNGYRIKELKRKDLRRQRAKQLLSVSSLPENMQTSNQTLGQRALQVSRHKHRCHEEYPFAPEVNRRSVPDFQHLQNQLEKNLQLTKLQKKTTVPEPFNLHDDIRSSCAQRHQAHKEEVMRKHVAMRRSRSAANLSGDAAAAVRTNVAATLRSEAIRKQLDDWSLNSDIPNHVDSEAQIKEKIRLKLRRQDLDFQKHLRNTRNKLREADAVRREEYWSERRQMEQRLAARPTVLQQQEDLVRRQSAETKFQTALRSAGLNIENLRKSRPATNGQVAVAPILDLSAKGGEKSGAGSERSSASYTLQDGPGISRPATNEQVAPTLDLSAKGGEKSGAGSERSSASYTLQDRPANAGGDRDSSRTFHQQSPQQEPAENFIKSPSASSSSSGGSKKSISTTSTASTSPSSEDRHDRSPKSEIITGVVGKTTDGAIGDTDARLANADSRSHLGNIEDFY